MTINTQSSKHFDKHTAETCLYNTPCKNYLSLDIARHTSPSDALQQTFDSNISRCKNAAEFA